MANLPRKQLYDVESGLQFVPITHTQAVLDNNGKTAEQRISNAETNVANLNNTVTGQQPLLSKFRDDEDSFLFVDGSGNVVAKTDASGIGAKRLNVYNKFGAQVGNIYMGEEGGYYFCDAQGNIAVMIGDDGTFDCGKIGKTLQSIIGASKADLYLPKKIYAVVGDTLQLFYRAIVKDIDPYKHDIVVKCSKGKAYSRYYEYTPTSADIGSTTLNVSILSASGDVVSSASATLATVAAPTSPSSAKQVFCIGDSLTAGGDWPCEFNRRLTNTNSVSGIAGKGLSNISFKGDLTVTKNSTTTKYYGKGGASWATYEIAGQTNYRFTVSGVSSLSLGATYTNNSVTYTILEINITSGSGTVLCSGSSAPQSSGTLTKTGGDGDASVSFSAYVTESGNPLWDNTNHKFSFVPYVTANGGSISVMYVLLTWNTQQAWAEYSGDSNIGIIANAKTFARQFHIDYPNAKLKIVGLQMPSIDGGLGDSYGASGDYIDRYGLFVCAWNYNKALEDMCSLSEFSPYCEFVDIATQFDSENNMPQSLANVNTRSTIQEMRGTNGVHPKTEGYYQIADAVYRNFVANYCQ